MWRRSPPMSAATWPWAGPPTTSNSATPRSGPSPRATRRRAAFPPDTGRPRCTWRPSRCRASSRIWWRRRSSADQPFRSAGGLLLADVVVELDQHVVRIGQENLPARAVRHHVHTEAHPFLRKVLLHRLKSPAAEGDVVDDAGIRRLLLVGGRDIVEVQHRMAFAVEPGAGKVEWRARSVHQAENVLVEPNGIAELAGRDVIMIEHTDAHAHLTSPFGPFRASAWTEFAAAILPRNAPGDERPRRAEARLQDCGERGIMAPASPTGAMSWRSTAAVFSR